MPQVPDEDEEEELQSSFKSYKKPQNKLEVNLDEEGGDVDYERDIMRMKESVMANKKQLEMI